MATRDPDYSDLASDPNVTPYKVGSGEAAHYWIRVHTDGRILDLNFGPDEEPYPRYCRYRRGEEWTKFQPRTAGSNVPHRNDARLIMERVRRNERAGRSGGEGDL